MSGYKDPPWKDSNFINKHIKQQLQQQQNSWGCFLLSAPITLLPTSKHLILAISEIKACMNWAGPKAPKLLGFIGTKQC